LEDDALRRRAELHFSALDLNKDKQHEEIIKQLREKGMSDEELKSIMASYGDNLAGNVEIITLALPTAANGYQSVSMYCDGNSSFRNGGKGSTVNVRATSVAQACGHKDLVIMGDIYIGRAHDDERVEWVRLDLPQEDFGLTTRWVGIAAIANAGKNMSGYSTSGTLQNMNQQQSLKAPGAAAPSVSASSVSIAPIEIPAEGFFWTQDQEEIELRMVIPSHISAKHLLIKILPEGRIILGQKKVSATEGSPIHGVNEKFCQAEGAELFGPVDTNDSTWSVESERDGRYLTITLAKKQKKNWKTFLK
jgi:hypothetical protein